MSKVKIQGNASGSGVITLTAPNTSTDRTVVLPDADVTLGADATKLPLAGGTVTGQIAIDQNSNARALTIDSESTSESGIVIDASVLTTGRAAHFYSNAPDTSTRNLVVVENDHASATGVTAFKVMQDSTGLAADFAGTGGIRSAGGIKFGTDTAEVNALDDYEEGTFTPTLIDTSNNAIASYTTQVGEYTKIGDIVHYFIHIEINSKGSALGGNYMKIAGLPFNPTGNTGQYPASTAHAGINTGSNGFFASVYSNIAFLYLFEGSSDDTTDQLEPSEFAEGDAMHLIGTYKTAS